MLSKTYLAFILFAVLITKDLTAQGLQVNVSLKPSSSALQAALSPRETAGQWQHPLVVQWQNDLQLLEYAPIFPNATAPELKSWFSLTFISNDNTLIISTLRQCSQFTHLELNRARQMHNFTNDPLVGQQYYHQLIKTESAWDSTEGGGLPVAIIDTGIDQMHPELASKLWINSAEDFNQNGRLDSSDLNGIDDDGNGYIDDVIGYDFADQPLLLGGGDDLVPDPEPFDDNGHGTAVSGVIAAEANNNYGGAGIAPNTRLMTLRAFTQSGVGEDDDISRAIIYAADNSARVLNLSFGDIYPSQLMRTACKYAYDRGVLMVSSAGNASGDLLAYPSGFGEVIAVSGTSFNADTDNEFLWPFSNYGHTIDLCAPASGILTAWPSGTSNPNPGGDSLFTTINGTSFAAPMVAAGAALLLSMNTSLSPQQVRGVLTSTADDLDDPGWDHFTGAGRLNLERALQFVGGVDVQLLSPENDGGTGENVLPVVGNILHPQLELAQLYYREGRGDSTVWISIGNPINTQRIEDTLHVWNVTQLAEGEYTLRLSVSLKNGQTVEDRVRVLIDRSAPDIEIIRAQTAWNDDRNGLFVSYRSDDIARCRLVFDGQNGEQTRLFDKVVRNGEFYVPEEELRTGGTNWRVQCTNAAGLTSSTTGRDYFPQPSQIRRDAVTELDYSLPMGFYLTDPVILGDQRVVYSDYSEQLTFGKLKVSRFSSGGQFNDVDSISSPSILIPKQYMQPVNMPDAYVLSNLGDTTYLHRFENADLISEPVLQFNNGRFPIMFSDLDLDGQHELLMRDSEARYVMEWNGSNYIEVARLPDPEVNNFGVGSPRGAIGDTDGDGQLEFWFGDYDGHIYGWEATGNDSYTLIQTITTPQQVATSEYTSIADLNGDGLPELVVASHSTELRNFDDEYDPQYWTLKVYSTAGNDSLRELASTVIYKHFGADFNALTVRNLTNDNTPEIFLTCFPRTYVFQLKDSTLTPLWYGPGLADAHVVGDFNENGTPEFCVGLGENAPFFELKDGVGGPSPLLSAEVIANDEIQLKWNAIPDAQSYIAYRQVVMDTLEPTFDGLANTGQTTELKDADVQLNQEYAYFVIANTPGGPVQSNLVRITPRAQISLINAAATSSTSVRLQFDGQVLARESDLQRFTLNTGVQPSQSLLASQTSLLLSFPSPLAAGNYTIAVDTNFLDANGRKLTSDAHSASFLIDTSTITPLIFTRWEKLSAQSARLYLSEPVIESSLSRAAFDVLPNGQPTNTIFADASRQIIDLSWEGPRLGAMGYSTSVRMTRLAGAEGGVIVPGQGDVAAFIETTETLESVYVYPNPVDRGAVQTAAACRFANVPPGATITIMTSTGFRVRSLQETDSDGGVIFDLRDNTGTQLRPGIYLYKITLPTGEETLKQFSITR